ncbi:hypothetical protein Tco_0343419 [Tanacetum coccineum]
MTTQQRSIDDIRQNVFQKLLANMLQWDSPTPSSTSGTFRVIPFQPKGEIETRSLSKCVAYEGPSILTNHSPKKVVERETEETTDKEQYNFQGSTAQIPPPVIPSTPETQCSKDLHKTPIPEPNVRRLTNDPALVCLPSEYDNDEKENQEVKNLAEPTAKRQTRITPCLKNFKVIQKESIFHSNKTPQVSSVFAITSTLPSIEPKDSLIMGTSTLALFVTMTIHFLRRRFKKKIFKFIQNTLFAFLITNYKALSDINPLFKEMLEDVESKDSNVSNFDEPCFTFTHHFSDKRRVFRPQQATNDEIDTFLSYRVPTYIKEGYYDSEGDVLYLMSLLSDDNTYNLSYDVFFDHESNHDTLITFSSKNDPLHHEFTGEVITIPPGIVREHEDYINRMSLLCRNSLLSVARKIHNIYIESLPTHLLPLSTIAILIGEIDI